MVLGVIQAGQAITAAAFIVVTPFNPGAAIQFGTTTNPSAFLGIADSTPTVVSQFLIPTIAIAPSNDLLILSVVGATVGAGVLYYRIYDP
jgi:hypothetical protein